MKTTTRKRKKNITKSSNCKTRTDWDNYCLFLWKTEANLRFNFTCQRPNCPNCHNTPFTKGIQVHHIIPRTNYALRHDTKNSCPLCCGSHEYWIELNDPIHIENIILPFLKANFDYSYLELHKGSQTKLNYFNIAHFLEQKIFYLLKKYSIELSDPDKINLTVKKLKTLNQTELS